MRNPDVGVWISEDKNLEIEIYKAGPQYFAKQIWGAFLLESDDRTSKKDLNDSPEGMRKRDPNNVIFIRNLDYDCGIYVGGLLYDYIPADKTITRFAPANPPKSG